MTKVKGHVDEEMVSSIFRPGRKDDEAAAYGRWRVQEGLLMLGVARVAVDDDDVGGTAIDPCVWSAGSVL